MYDSLARVRVQVNSVKGIHLEFLLLSYSCTDALALAPRLLCFQLLSLPLFALSFLGTTLIQSSSSYPTALTNPSTLYDTAFARKGAPD